MCVQLRVEVDKDEEGGDLNEDYCLTPARPVVGAAQKDDIYRQDTHEVDNMPASPERECLAATYGSDLWEHHAKE